MGQEVMVHWGLTDSTAGRRLPCMWFKWVQILTPLNGTPSQPEVMIPEYRQHQE